MSQSTEAKNYSYLSQKPGIQIFKPGTFDKIELDGLLGKPDLNSQIIDVPVTATANPLTIGFFSMQPGDEFEFVYEFLEYKVITKGKFVLRDKQGNKYVAEAGDVVLFTPNVPVIFDGESDGEAIYTKHAAADAAFMK
ncbi:hypothetical protein [Peribacillus loiseleuriae]|uniref:hypothetical protein n=1 Tax=Peribacillus loiseleuriae TaxID=1679170 RepID=UPI003D03C9DC